MDSIANESYHMPVNCTRAAKISPCSQSNHYDWLERRLFPKGIDVSTLMYLKIKKSSDTEKLAKMLIVTEFS